jgi:hypothetical protein
MSVVRKCAVSVVRECAVSAMFSPERCAVFSQVVRCFFPSAAQLWRYFSEYCGFCSLPIYYQCPCELISCPCFLAYLFWVQLYMWG